MQRVSDDIRPAPHHGWLVALLPADARRFRATDPEVAAILREAGGELVDLRPDVELAAASELQGDASFAVATVSANRPLGHALRAVRAAVRIRTWAGVRARVARARHAARRRGYRRATAVTWETHVTLTRSLAVTASDRRLFHRFPIRIALACARRTPARTMFEAALAEAEQAYGRRLDIGGLLLGSSGVIVSTAGDAVLRVSLGGPGRRVQEARDALAELSRVQPPAVVSDRIPWVLASGSAGLAVWSLERRLPGRVPAPSLDARLAADCLDFLEALHQSGGAEPARSPLDDGETVAAAFPEAARQVLELCRRLHADLASLPRGFAHGDFWTGNLLAESGRLTGVVDWPSAGAGRLPLLDLLHLRVNARRELTRAETAEIVLEQLLPEARAGGDPLIRAYCERVGVSANPDVLEALVGAYWLDELAHDVSDPDRDPSKPLLPRWRHANLAVLTALSRNPKPAVSRK